MGTLRIGEIFRDSTLTLIAVESVDSRHSKTNSACQVYGKLEPIAVIVCSPNGAYALTMEAKPANLDQLRQDIPELDAAMDENSCRL